MPIPPVKVPCEGVEWSRGISDLAAAIRENRPHRVTGAHAAHVVEILEGIHLSIADSRAVEMRSSFALPEPMKWTMGK